MKKKCPKCGKRRAFHSNAARYDGLDSWCKFCRSKYHSEYYKSNPTKRLEKDAKFDAANPTYNREYALRTKYNLTEELFLKILRYQNGRCAICKTDAPGGRYGKWFVDHDHETNIVRGLLCFNCNKHLGFYERIAEGIEEYLKNPPAQKVLRGL